LIMIPFPTSKRCVNQTTLKGGGSAPPLLQKLQSD
jgi:hypothetical protein